MIKIICLYSTIFSLILSFFEKKFDIEFYLLSICILFIYFDLKKKPDKIECSVNLSEECVICYEKSIVLIKFNCCKQRVCNFCFLKIHSCPICRENI